MFRPRIMSAIFIAFMSPSSIHAQACVSALWSCTIICLSPPFFIFFHTIARVHSFYGFFFSIVFCAALSFTAIFLFPAATTTTKKRNIFFLDIQVPHIKCCMQFFLLFYSKNFVAFYKTE